MSRRDRQLTRRLIAQHQAQQKEDQTLNTQLAELERQYAQSGCRVERGLLLAQYTRLRCGRVLVGDPYWLYEAGLDPRARPPSLAPEDRPPPRRLAARQPD
ncbi:hypothetical protein [Deinococcus radiophilus]|uniref:Uncharacterized protein n=1 Tax=Deinococcus radiophilus TaxID=32062 RepID=A0A431W0L1_9DEIO|nr:hypothetical protein [Deinococcus radiophilus]RTR29050.1 hypothetical protein EJ104_04185 [Deinococcus radiophilus]UFA49637.1 hypothetical protein LMT64_06945 [Deinococcus radiophilus]